MTNLDHALALASQGLPVFPCNPSSKAPLIEGQGGFKAATTDTTKIGRWWQENPDALIGVPTGAASGYDALDVDPRHGGAEWLKANAHRLRGARWHATRSGGLHFLFRHAEGLRLSAGTVAPGIDVRADGGYVVWWPAHGLRVSEQPVAPWPDDLLAEVRAARPAVQDQSRRDPALLAPPSAAALVDLLHRLPNPLETTRDEWLAVLMATRGCLQGLEAVGGLTSDAQADIEEALFAWCDRWPAAQDEDPREKWERDILSREAPLAGWQTLERIAGRWAPELRAEIAQETAAAEFAAAPAAVDALLDELDAQTWAKLDLPPTRQYLGAVLQTATRLNLIGSTGLGKTQITHAMAASIASGHGFGPWAGGAPARVLIVDGEMSTRLLKARVTSALARHGHPVPCGNLLVYGVDRGEHFKAAYPWLGDFHPLNLPDGAAFLRRLVGHVKPEVVFFDNVMSLMAGDQKDEVTWSGALNLMGWLTRAGIAQVWLDHTTHTANRQYGSVTKMWRADAVGVMSPVDKKDLTPGQVKFTLTFSAPQGKARERDEVNYRDFADRLFTMDANGWQHAEVQGDRHALEVDPVAKLKPSVRVWYDLLVEMGDQVDRADWLAAGVRSGLTEPIVAGLSQAERNARSNRFNTAVRELRKAGLIQVANVTDIMLVRDGALAALRE